MKKTFELSLRVVILAEGIFSGTPTRAAIVGINTASSSAQITFDDTNSFSPAAMQGITNLTIPQPAWNGSLFSLPTTTDPNTGDSAAASISATFTALSYALNLTGVQIAQPFLNTGYAVLQVNFSSNTSWTGPACPPSRPSRCPLPSMAPSSPAAFRPSTET